MVSKVRFCERCKVEIPAERVEALPDTRLCVRCCQEVGGEFDLIVGLESLGKAGSLKRNYGSVNIEKRRRRIPPKE